MLTRRIDSGQKHQLVLKAALELFVKYGFHSVSIPDIVKASGVSTGSIYNYFINKEELGRALYSQTQENFTQVFAERLRGKENTYEKLRAFVELVFEFTEHDPTVMEYMLLVRHTEFLKKCAPICNSEPFRLVRKILSEGMARNEVKEQDVFISGICFTGVVLRAAELRLTGVYPHSLLETLDCFMESAWSAVKKTS